MSNYQITHPPYYPHVPNVSDDEPLPFFAHVRFNEKFVYAVAARATGSSYPFSDQRAFEAWLNDYTRDHLVPAISQHGQRDLMFVIDSLTPLTTSGPYPYKPVPETRLWKVSQAIEFYYFPPMWVIDSAERKDRTVDFPRMAERVYRKRLAKSGIQIAATRDGQFLLDFSDWRDGCIPLVNGATAVSDANRQGFALQQARWISVGNVFLTLLYAYYVETYGVMHSPLPIAPRRIGLRMGIDQAGGGSSGRAHFGLNDARDPRTYKDEVYKAEYSGSDADIVIPPGITDWRIVDRSVLPPIPKEVLDKALNNLDDLVEMPVEKGIHRIELCGHAASAYQDRNFSLALLQSWPVLESLLIELWRKSTGRTTRPPRVADVITALQSSSDITSQCAGDCNLARVARNELLHDLKPPTYLSTDAAFNALKVLLLDVLGLDLRLPRGIGYSGTAAPA